MKLQNCDRNGCFNLRGNYIRYERVLREYRCMCGASLSTRPVMADYVVQSYRLICADCGDVTEVVHYNAVFQEALTAAVVMENLPADLRALLADDEGAPDMTVEEIVNLLF